MESSSESTSREILSKFQHEFRSAVDDGGFLLGVKRLLVAASGGADSTALALLFSDYSKSLGAGAAPVVLLGHVHHGIRGEEADGDEEFVHRLAAGLAFPYLVERVSVPCLVRDEGHSVEVAARRLRYQAFRRWADENELDAIALAHHRDDQQETVLLRLARGTGLKGLGGIPATRALDECRRDVRLIRPLLGWTRNELRDYLRLRGQRFREDSSNQSLEYPRNAIRQRVIPLLEEKVHPGVRQSIERLAGSAQRLAKDLAILGERAFEEARISTVGDVARLDLRSLRAWPSSVLREVLVRTVGLVDSQLLPPSQESFSRFASLICGESDARSIDLGQGVIAERRYGSITLYRDIGEDYRGDDVLRLSVDDHPISWGGWRIGAERCSWPGESGERWEEWVDEASLGSELTVRCRRAGDLFQSLGAPGKKKLKEFFRERRIPPRLRDSCPLVVAGQEIVWVVGERLGQSFRVRPESRSTVRLYAVRESPGL